jgi:hypothetical protein
MLLPIYNNKRGCVWKCCHLPATFDGIQATMPTKYAGPIPVMNVGSWVAEKL